VATKRRGDTNDRAAVNMKKAQISQIGRKASPDTPTLPSLKPRSPRPGLFIAAEHQDQEWQAKPTHPLTG
jgi:hypothetical protein